MDKEKLSILFNRFVGLQVHVEKDLLLDSKQRPQGICADILNEPTLKAMIKVAKANKINLQVNFGSASAAAMSDLDFEYVTAYVKQGRDRKFRITDKFEPGYL